ncbi:MAG: DUF177 domain-containing protein [Rikenellaceae bacterium]
MAAVNSYKIEYKALGIGEYAYSFTIDDALFASYEGCEISHGEGSASVSLKRSETMLELEVAISARVTTPCDRCLDDCQIAIEFQAPLVVKFSDETDLYDGEVMWIPTGQSHVDLAHYIYESIIISLPYQRTHAEGECNPEMMERFKIVSNEEFDELEQNQKAKSHSLASDQLDKLSSLKREMESED